MVQVRSINSSHIKGRGVNVRMEMIYKIIISFDTALYRYIKKKFSYN